MSEQYSEIRSRQQKNLFHWHKAPSPRKLGFKILLGLMTLGSCLPGVASANDITAAAGFSATHVSNPNGPVTTVTTDKIINKNSNNSTAVNVFDKYVVNANNIANMHFGHENDNGAANLVNFVRSKVDINGVVNAVQNNKIGGNIYFLSSNGIAVGSTGVINAGSVNLITPTQKYMDGLVGAAGSNVPAAMQNTINDATLLSIVNPATVTEIPLNPAGTISVDGQIHAVDGITMRTGHEIDIGTKTGAQALLETGRTDFSSLVNVKDGASAGLASSLKATQTGNGDIVLSVSATEKNVQDASFHNDFLDTVMAKDANNTMEAKIVQGSGSIAASGNVRMTATAHNETERVAQTVAQIDVTKGEISGKNVAVHANAENLFVDSGNLTSMDAPITILGVATVNMDADYAYLGSKAAVNVGSAATLTATGENTTDGSGQTTKALDIQAESTLGAKMGAATTPFKFANIKFSNIAPASAITYLHAENSANVQLDGTLKTGNAKGDANVAAIASTEIAADASTTTTTITGNPSLYNAALLVLDASNTSAVNVGSAAKLQDDNLKGKLDITSTANNSLTSTVSTTASDNSAVATAFNITSYNSSSDVDVAAGMKAADVNIQANNNVLRNTVTTTNGIGSTAFMKNLTNKVTGSKTFDSIFNTTAGSNSVFDHIVGILPNKLQNIIHSPADAESLGEQAKLIGQLISAGVGIQYVDESNTSKVTVHPVSITASTGDVSIGAKTDIQDTRMVVTGTANNQQDNSQVQYTVDGALLIANMNNTSKTVVEGEQTTIDAQGTKKTSHAIITGKDVKITASTQMPYNRVKVMIADIQDAIDKVTAAFKTDGYSTSAEYLAAVNKVQTAADTLSKVNEGNSLGDKFDNLSQALSNYASAYGEYLTLVNKNAQRASETITAPIAVLTSAAQFASTDQYANFYVRTIATENKADKDSKLAAAGSINVTDVTNDSSVLIGKKAELTATGALKTTAETKAENVSFTGNASSLLLPSSANAAGAGVSLAIQRFSGDSLALVAEEATLSGAAIDIEANTTLTPTGIVISAGTAGTNGLSGMVNIMSGSGAAVASVDDEASLTANKAGTGTITAKENDGSITIDATNTTALTNVAGGFMKAGGTSVGMGVAVNDYSVNTVAGVFDNDADTNVTENTEAATAVEKAVNKKKAASKLALELTGLNAADQKALLGSSSTSNKGLLKGQKVATDATTKGLINSVGLTGTASSSGDSGEEGFLDKVGNYVSGIKDKITTPINNGMSKVDGYMSGKLNNLTGYNPSQMANSGSSDQKAADAKPNDLGSATKAPTITVAGSVAVNMLDGQTSVLLDNANVTLLPDSANKTNGSLSAIASDQLLSGAWAGAAAINWATTTKQESSGTAVGVSGAAAVNLIDRNVDSIISNSAITNAGSIINSASKDGAEVAAGLGMTMSKSTGSSSEANVAVSAAFSLNDINNEVHALMIGDTVSTNNGAVTTLQNDAYNGDIQITGGIDTAFSFGGSSGAGVGGTVVIGKITNDVQSGLYGGNYTQMGDVDIDSAIATKQFGVGVGVAASSSSDSGTFNGVVAYNDVSNTANAVIDGSTVTAASDKTVTVKAYDTNSLSNSHSAYIQQHGLYADEASYAKAIEQQKSDQQSGESDKTTQTDKTIKSDQDYNTSVSDSANKADDAGGNLIVTGALSVSGSGGKAAIGAGVAVDEITNDFTSNITNNAKITAGTVKGTADTDTLLIGFAAGAAGSGNFGGAGSVSWQDLNSSAVTTVNDSTITANKADFSATNDTIGVNVAGQVSVGKVATGLAMAYHGLDNTTGAYVYGSELNALDAATGINVGLDAESNAKIFSVGVGVGVSTSEAAINGVVTMNRGSNTTEAVIDSDGVHNDKGKRTTITNANDVKTTAKDATITVAIAGGATAGSGTAVGGSIAINDIGGFSSDGAKSSQNIKSQINNTDITSFTPAAGAADKTNLISTDASDDAHMITVAVGVAGSSQTAVQGSAATSLINKDVQSGMKNTNIDAATANAATAKLSTMASNDALIVANATVLAVGDNAGGAGVGVNRIVQNTEASVTDGTQYVDRANISANAHPVIIATGIGGAGGGTAAVAGSFGVNIIDNSAKALLSGATMVSQGNIGVVAQSDESIANYAGAVAGAGTAAIGIASSVNTISGNTEALVENSTVTAKGSNTEAIDVYSTVNDSDINSHMISSDSFVPDVLRGKRQKESKTGLVVNSSSTHDMLSVEATVGGGGVATVFGTVNVNSTDGSTTAAITNSDINTQFTTPGTATDVTVKAADYTNAAGVVGSISASGNASVGAATDTQLVDRAVTAKIEGKGKSGNTNLYADDLDVNAVAKQGISSATIGVAVGVEGAGVSGTASVVKLKGTTNAIVDKLNAQVHNADIEANHKANVSVGNLSIGGAGIGAGIGLSVGLVLANDTTQTQVTDSKLVSNQADSSITVKSDNADSLVTAITSAAITGIGVSVNGTTAVNNFNNTVTTKVAGSDLKAHDVTVDASNYLSASMNDGSIGGAGGVSIGASVGVNTIDSVVAAQVIGGTITTAGDTSITAEETRDIEQSSMNAEVGLAAISGNIMTTTVGSSVDADVKEQIDSAAQSANNGKRSTMLGLTTDEKNTAHTTQNADVGYGGNVDANNKLISGVSTSVSGGATLTADGNASITTTEKSDVTMYGGNASLSAASANGSVGILKVHHNAVTDVTNGTISANTVTIASTLADKQSGAKMNLYQGTGGAYALGAAYGKVSVDGTSGVHVNDSTITATKGNVGITATDTSTATVNAYALTGGAIAAGAIVADAGNDSTTEVTLDHNNIVAGDGNITAAATKANAATAKAYSGMVGIAAINAAAASASDSGTSSVALTGTKGANSLQGKAISLTASNTPTIKAVAGVGTLTMDFSGGSSIATAKAAGKAKVSVIDKTALLGDTVTINGTIGTKDSVTPNVYAEVIGIGGSLEAAMGINLAQANNSMDAEVTVGDSTYKTETTDGVTTGATDLSVSAENNTQAEATAKGMTIGGAFASGTNKVLTANTSHATASLAGAATGQTLVKSLTVKAVGSSVNTGDSHGDGGAIVDISPLAAVTDNNTNNTSKANVSGGWNVDGTVDVEATQRLVTNLTTDTLTATVIGGSGAASSNTVDSTSEVNLSGANITSSGAQNYLAQNTLAIKNDVKASGYGAGVVAASSQTSDFNFTANVNMTGSTLHNTGEASDSTSNSITAQALTTGAIANNNTIKSAGVVAGTFASSEGTTTYNNNVTLKSSTLTTDATADDIRLAASDDTNVDLSVLADTQGGMIGASSAKNKSNFKRANGITVDGASKLFSTNDIDLYAGVDGSGNKSTLNYNIGADAYNKTGIPLATVPSISNTMSQSNTISLGGTAESVRHINLKAGKGIATVAESAKEYKWLGGESGHGNLASTVLGDTIKNQTTNNMVTVEGSATAGIHNSLDIALSGQVKEQSSSDPNAPALDTSSFKLTLGNGSEWFKNTDWYKANVDANGHIKVSEYDLINNLKDRYDQVVALMKKYSPGTDSYTYYAAEVQRLGSLLVESGFATPEKDASGNITGYSTTDTQPLPAIILGKLAVSGGNINIDSDAVGGAGKLTAKGNPSLSVTNASDAYLVIDGAEISDAGGNVNYNDASYKAGLFGSTFTGTVSQDTANGQQANITIHGTTPANTNSKLDIQADIGILGNVVNKAGNVSIVNDNYDIMVDGTATVSGNTIRIAAPKGSVSQSSPTGVINVGGDPIEQYSMQTSIMDKVQKYFGNTTLTQTFATWADYAKWVKEQEFHPIEGITLKENIFDLTSEEQDYIDRLIKASASVENSGGIVAGGNIYINGADVNINGLVQSGFDKYSAVLTDAEAAKISILDANYDGRTLTDRDVLGNPAYRIHGAITSNASGVDQTAKVSNIIFNTSKGAYDYDISLYYNPQTKQIITDTVDVKGGQIYITGAISSTGNGKIFAANGVADINIDTTISNRDVLVNTIANQNVNGFVSITDTNRKQDNTNRPLVTEYTNGTALSYWQGDASKTPVTTYNNTASKYDVDDTLSYNWTGGVKSTVVESWNYHKKFIAWGLIKFKKTEEMETAAKADKDNTSLSTTTTAAETLPNGFVISKGSSLGSNDFSITSKTKTNDAVNVEYSDVTISKKYSGVAGKIFGYGIANYDWTKTYGTTTDVVYRVNASKDIDVGFLNSGKDQISVATGGSLLVNDSISNAGTTGTMNLSSQLGSVSRVDGNTGSVVTDHLTTTAATGINLYHQSISGTSNVDLSTTSGNIDFVSKKGDINLQQAVTGGTNAITATTGNVNLSAEGSLLNGNTAAAYVVKGQRIDLASQTGSIGTKAAALTIQSGSEMYSADSMDASVNATAQGDIVLTQGSGNMRLGEVKSYGGDAVLTVKNGSFADALRDTENSDPTAAVDKIKQWKDMGLISDLDGDDTSSNAGTNAKTIRLDALTVQANALAAKKKTTDAGTYIQKLKNEAAAMAANGEINTLRQAYLQHAASGTSSSTADALAAYKKAQNAYFDAKGYTADEKAWITSWSEVNGADGYGWSKNQLLYAIQDSIVNSKPGEVPFVKTANVKANNIVLNAANGGVGIDKDAKVITYADTGKIENLKILAAAKGGDLTWDDTNKVVTVRQQQPINVELNTAKGLLDVTGRDNVYLAGKEDTAFNINNIVTAGDIKLMSQGGINAVNNTGTTLTGANLIIRGGTGSIGSSDHMITTNLSGTVDANSGESIYINQVSDRNLIIQDVAAGQEVYLGAVNDIRMSQEVGKNMGYINSTKGPVTLNSAKGSLGLADDALRILGTGALVNASAYNIYLDGKGTGNLALGTVNAGASLQATSENGTVSVGTATTTGHVKAQRDSAITSYGDISLHGDVTVGNGKDLQKLNLTSTNGGITQTTDSSAYGITANTLNVTTYGGQSLANTDNAFSNLSINGMTNKLRTDNGYDIYGDVIINTNAPDTLSVDLNHAHVNGNISITNRANGGRTVINSGATAAIDSAAEKDITITTDGDMINNGKLVSDKGTITLASQSGHLTTNDVVLAPVKVNLLAPLGVTNNSTVGDQGTKEVILNADTGNIINTGDIVSTEGVVIMNASNGGVYNQGSVTSNTYIFMQALQDIINSGDVTAKGGSVTMTAQHGTIVNSGKVTAKQGDVQMNSNWNMTNTGAITSDTGMVDLISGGSIANKDSVTGHTDVRMSAVQGITNMGAVASENSSIVMTATNGNIDNRSTLIANNGRVELRTKLNSISNSADVTAKYIDMDSNMNLNNVGNLLATDDVVLLQANGNMNNLGNVTAQGGLAFIAGGTMLNKGNLTSLKSNIELTGKKGITNEKVLMAGGSVTETNLSGNILNQGDIITGTAKIEGIRISNTQGNITNNGRIQSTSGSVNMTASSGAITNTKAVLAAGPISMQARGNIVNKNTVMSPHSRITEISSMGSITNNGIVSAKGDMTMKSYGSLTNTGNVEVSNGTIEMTSTKGMIRNASVHAGSNITIRGYSGILNNAGKPLTDSGRLIMTKTTGSIVNRGLNNAKDYVVKLYETESDGTQVFYVPGGENGQDVYFSVHTYA